ncbi:MAG TPA: flippase activity-associated protein Agl23 [bacterium]|nr:flippase activity-associated protein Agl23 [bacterium]
MADNKICEKCGAKNPASNNFCEQCGAKLTSQEVAVKVTVPKPTPRSEPAKTEPAPDATIGSPDRSWVPANSFHLGWMSIAYAVLLLVTVFTRFDHLGAKPHHHDESMHAFYSYQLFKDGDYEYNPMMHGPFQFHGNAFMYYLFGVSNATSRYLAASFGILTVILAMLLGPFLGRWGTFLATSLIVISPSFMYFDRFTREDAYILGGTFLMVVYAMRYYRSRVPSDLWLAALGFGIAFCTKESIFITVAVLGTYLFIRLLPWLDVLISGGLVAFGLLLMMILDKGNSARPVLFGLCLAASFGYTLLQLALRWMAQRGQNKAESPLWETLLGLRLDKIGLELGLTLGWWVGAILLVRLFPHFGINLPGGVDMLWVLAFLALLGRFGWLWLTDRAPAMTGSITIFGILFTLLFTTFFTVGGNQADFSTRFHSLLNSLYMGAFGGLEYWWGQQGVHRGDQPWYYYLLQLPANEMVSFFFSLVAMAYYGLVKRRNLPLFLAYWYVGSLALFSWAGEKMPWLILHPLLPALLLTAYFIGDLIESVPAGSWGRMARTGALGLFGLLSTYSLHSAVLLSFYHECNPVEPLVYVQSGPDCLEVERIIRRISYDETGGPNPEAPAGISEGEKAMHDGLPLTIEDKCSWPFAWILREFSRRNHPSSITMADNPIILTGTETDSQSYPILSAAGYVDRKYKLRIWWIPSWFKKGFPQTDLTPGLLTSWFFSNILPFGTPKPDMVDWNDLKDWILYRKVWSDLGSYNMRLWVRKDLADKYGYTHTDRADIPADYPKPEPIQEPTLSKGNKHGKH